MIFLLIKFSITFGSDMFFQIERVYILYDNNLGGMFSYIYKNIYLWISVLQICIQHSAYIVLSKYCGVGLLPFDVFNNYEFHIQQYGLRLKFSKVIFIIFLCVSTFC